MLQEPEHRDQDEPAPDLQYTDSIPKGSSRAPIGALIAILALALALFLFFAYAFYDIP